MNEAEFRALFERVSTWGRWGEQAERGALNHITPERVAAAARLVQTGVTVSLSHRLVTGKRIDVPTPADHHMTMLPDEDTGSGALRFAKDYIGLDYHNEGHTHIDAFSHIAFDGRLYDGVSAAAVTEQGAGFGVIDVLKDGLIGRGVMLDIPRSRSTRWLEPGEDVHTEDLEEAEREQGVRAGAGDILLIRTGHARRLMEMPAWDTARAKAGLDPAAATFLAEREISVLGSDGNNDTAPSTTEGIGFPIHVLALNAIGVPLLDYLQLEDLARRCEEDQRWEFLFAAAPLRLARGTGSPLNPTAIF
jgi:kynurenine formamidase